LQVRVCVPQFPHACELAPEHAQIPFTQLDPEGQHKLLLPHGGAPPGHRHFPLWQVVPAGQTVPHAPQFWLSVCRFLQSSTNGSRLLQFVNPGPHAGATHREPFHVNPGRQWISGWQTNCPLITTQFTCGETA
jgi:hypothetical protein